MADLGLNLDLATSAVREDESKKVKKRDKKGRRPRPRLPGESKSSGSRASPPNSSSEGSMVEYYLDDAKRQAEVNRNGMTFLLHEEFSDSSDEDTTDDESDSYKPKLMYREGSRKKLGDGSDRYHVITGNVAPTELSIAKHFTDEDILKLLSEENFGVVLQPVGFWQVGKKNRKAKRGLDLVNVSVVQHEFKGVTAKSAKLDDDTFDDDDGNTEASAMLFDTKKKADRHKANKWPPRPIVDPQPPLEKPPRMRGSFYSRPKSTSMPPPPPPPPKKMERSPPRPPPRSPPPPLKKQGSLMSSSMVNASGVIKKNMKKLAKFRGPSTNNPPPQRNISANKIQERFLVAKRVNWIIPPPPRPKLPPPDRSDEQQMMRSFELLRMFCEDLRSAVVAIEEKQIEKSERIGTLQEEIQKMDDEIAGLVHPKGMAAGKKLDVVTSQLKSVTSGNIFRVEKY